MTTMKKTKEQIQAKWGIDLKNYSPWVDVDKVLDVMFRYKAKAGIKTDRALARAAGIAPQSMYQARKRGGKMMAVYAMKWLDGIEVDPKCVLEPATEEDKCEIDPVTSLFLDVFPDMKQRTLMVKYKKEIEYLVDQLEKAQK